MNLEGFSKRGMELGKDPEKINETMNDLTQQYSNAIKRLALQKMKNDLLFERALGAAMRHLSTLGLEVSKENMLRDIEIEVNRQQMSFDIELPNINIGMSSENTDNKSEIEQLKNSLASIFESAPVQEQMPIYNSGTTPGEPAIPNTQPYDPTMTVIGNFGNLSDDAKKRIIQQMESRGEVIISSIDNIHQEGNYIVVNAKDNQGRFTGTEFTLDDFTKLVNPITPIDKTEQISQQQNQLKSQIINQIMVSMNKAGELPFDNMSMDEKKSNMQIIQDKLNMKSIDELQMLLSTYQEQEIEKEDMDNEMRK